MSEYHYRGPVIDHGILSPSGKVSKRARDAALKREHDRLFPPGFWDAPVPTEAERVAAKVLSLTRHAETLEDLANRGMCVRKYRKEAARLREEAASLQVSR